ncbi:MAG: hypothetical protein OXC63_14195 [Aestuariivita sp.]|nr:hypothetical protein [Aestuariivita sp.]MCY4345171.1 hypothetical protein [Aestuariivita sp.]
MPSYVIDLIATAYDRHVWWQVFDTTKPYRRQRMSGPQVPPTSNLAEKNIRPEKGKAEDFRQLPQPIQCDQPLSHPEGARGRTQTELEHTRHAPPLAA